MKFQAGLYAAEFSTALDSSGGVAVLKDGQIRGGDATHYYIGTYTIEEDKISVWVSIRVYREEDAVHNAKILGNNNVDLEMQGSFTDAGLYLSAMLGPLILTANLTFIAPL